jgi:hypothetical protein
MSRTPSGGTKKWCPSCESTQVCTAFNPTEIGEKSGQRWYRVGHTDIQWFRRALICKKCNHTWLTAEIEESFLDELVQLREALGDIKKHAQAYERESKKASASLTKLSESLGVLKALDIYSGTPDDIESVYVGTYDPH